MKSESATWFWFTIAVSIISIIAVFVIPENFYPFAYIRNISGAIFILWLPGYTFIKALFPVSLPITASKNLKAIMQIALSTGFSIALVPIIGLFLDYSPWGIRIVSIVLSLFTLTLFFGIIAIFREYVFSSKTEK